MQESHLEALRDEIRAANGPSAARKAVTDIRRAFRRAKATHSGESGLRGVAPWWADVATLHTAPPATGI
ncbi:hypothetical protein [Afifella marina]|uniref:Uncharacterized protein n=1 Tax=Afifella marina DSM 2698 TaxID=1120955 RepID=A0A1G5MAG6_AFIMA|nr:hypothetical protein [Afifella marina]MBK1622830.1 hypothetical protein [Afifella marina DSM 2698]MBK1625825.1 hypothetical protein [Afifella marina]MBK5917647.1 hypothetical protein [Afifella marina]RAI23571.1 hypothetical protein CH311_01455 [Afifella marina DSM 2698]SCZ21390.1 hypothetical protein SAMN03080610_00258 [Afifella marina DSM 2698]